MAGTNQLGMQMHVLCYLGKIVGCLENQRNPGDTAEKWDEKPKKNSVFAALVTDPTLERTAKNGDGKQNLIIAAIAKEPKIKIFLSTFYVTICYLDVGLTCNVYFLVGRFAISRLHLHVDSALQCLNDETFSFVASMCSPLPHFRDKPAQHSDVRKWSHKSYLSILNLTREAFKCNTFQNYRKLDLHSLE